MDLQRKCLHPPIPYMAVETQTNGTAFESVRIQKASSQELEKISEKFQNSWAKEGCPSLSFVFVVSNRQLEHQWSAYKQNLSVEELFHGTTLQCDITASETVCNDKECGICGISRTGFDWQYIGKNIYQRFGHGFYFAPMSSKCHDYTQGAHSYRAMLLCDVCVGEKYPMKQDDENLLNPPQGYDSIYGKSGSGSVLNYDEIVVYNPDAILPRYILLYQKDGTNKFDRNLNHSELSATIPPLLITFLSGCCPKGLLRELGDCLVNEQVVNSKLIIDESESHTNQICFTMGLQKLLLKSNDIYIYIELVLDEEDKKITTELCTLCNIIRKLMEDTITEVLGYPSSATFRLSFKCQCGQKKEFHFAELRTDDPLKPTFFLCTQLKKKAPVSPQCHAWLPEPHILHHPESQSVAPGTEAVLSVKATGDSLRFRWQKDRGDIDDCGTRYRGTQTNTLQILEVEKGDKGRYGCLVMNDKHRVCSDEALLVVADPPEVTQHPKHQSAFIGADIAFTVEATGDDLRFQWQKDGKDIDSSESRFQCNQMDKTSTLHIQRVKKSDKGHYSCLVKNPVEERGKPSRVAELTVYQMWKKLIVILCVIVLILFKLEIGFFWMLAREYQSIFSCLPCNVQSLFNIDQCAVLNTSDRVLSSFKLDITPSLDALRNFPVKNRTIDIAEKIGANYEHFGTLLLNDIDGTKVNNIEVAKRGHPVDITVEILEQWLQGRGLPATWQTLVKCLRDMKWTVLANNIESSLLEHNGNKDPDRVPSEEL